MTLGDTLRYVYEGLRDGYDDPYWWRGRFLEFVVAPLHTRVFPRRTDAIEVTAQDWDTLVVLDACRADLFEERASIDTYDDYRRVRSRGSTTLEWVEQNFAGREFGDVVYVTTNPYVSMAAGDAFHELIELWVDEFDEELDTVPPEAVVEAAREVHDRYPDKRVILHFMQPHHPFVTTPELQFDGWHVAEYEDWQTEAAVDDEAQAGVGTPWEALSKGVVDRQEVWEAYGENLDVALSAVDELLETVEGKVVVTSDHGNMLGERTFPVPLSVYGHPVGIRNDELVEVPWAVVQNGPRRTITEGAADSSASDDEETVEDRLEALGYR